MKYFTLLFLIVLIGSIWGGIAPKDMQYNSDQIAEGIASPEQALNFFDSFEAYVPFTPLCTQTNKWVTWDLTSGGANDPLVSNAQAYTGSNSVVITFNNDLVRDIGAPVTSGTWKFSWQMYIPTGKAGYFNTLATFDPPGHANTNWGLEVYFNLGGAGSVNAGGTGITTFSWIADTWTPVEVVVDLDNNMAEFWYNGSMVYSWQWTLGSNGGGSPLQVQANDFFGATADDEMYFDDYTVEEILPDLLFADSFDGYTAGLQLAFQNPVYWTTWSGMPGSSEDAYVSNAYAFTDSNSVVIVQNNDLVKTFGSLTTGKYYIDFMVYIPNGKAGYFNTLAGYTPNPFNWGMEAYFDVGGGGRLFGGSATAVAFSYDYDTWQSVEVVVDLDNDMAEFWFEGSMINSWQWTLGASGGGSPLQLDANDFFGATADDEMYIDNYSISAGPPVVPASIGVDPSSITDSVSVGDSMDVAIQISNTAPAGALALDWSASINFTKTTKTTVTMIAGEDARNAKILAVGTPVSLDKFESLKPSFTINPEEVSDAEMPFERNNSGISHIEGVMGEEVFGNNSTVYGPAGVRGRGNHFYCSTATTLIEHRLYLNMTVSSDIQFVVYEGSAQVGTYNLIDASEIASSGTGEGWYSSGPINVPLVAGMYYLIYAQWTQPANYYANIAASPYPVPASFGELQMGIGYNWVPTYTVPPATSQSVPSTAFGAPVAYYQTIVTGAATQPFMKLLEPTSGSIDPQDVATLTARVYGLDVEDTTYMADIEITSNDPANPTVTIPVEIYVPPVVGINDPNQAPYTFAVSQNYPNPFNPTTTIKYQLPQASRVTIGVYNLLGQKIRTLVNDNMEPGDHQVTWNGLNDAGAQVSSGVYFYRFQAGDFVSIKKMMFLK